MKKINHRRIVKNSRILWCVILLLIGLILIILQDIIVKFLLGLNVTSSTAETIKNIIICVGTSFVSASITIYLIKFDILDILQNNSMDKYGIIGIADGRDHVFGDIDTNGMSEQNWEEFLRNSSDKTIDIIGISMYSFLFHGEMLSFLCKLSQERPRPYKIRVVFADPSSQEVYFQSVEEGKDGQLSEHIKLVSSTLMAKKGTGKIQAYYSKTMPKAFIVRSGNRMVITPYLLSGPFKVPTLIVNEKGLGKNTVFSTYCQYIDKIIISSTTLQ